MRILILVLSYTELPWLGLMQAQWDTWDKEWVKNCPVVYYTGEGLYMTHAHVLCPHETPVSDDYYQMHWKFKLAMDGLDLNSFDFIFRTNSSSYINKERLLKHAETLPKERCYAGWSLGEKEAVSGAGIWLSPDMVDILREEIPPGENIEEDILIGRILHGKHGIEIIDDRSRFDVTDVDSVPLDRYHYRMKTPDRLEDIRNMYRLHSRIKDMRR